MDNAPTKGASALRSRAGDLWGVHERTDGSASGVVRGVKSDIFSAWEKG